MNETEDRLNAATEWAMQETGEPTSLERLFAHCEREIRRPRDPLHYRWALTLRSFLLRIGAERYKERRRAG